MKGWELVDIYTMIETVHPNFGNKKYVTGLQPNTRTQAICYVFKRAIKEGYPRDSCHLYFGGEPDIEAVKTFEAVKAPVEQVTEVEVKD